MKFVLSLFCLLLVSGCATVQKNGAQKFTISGNPYYSLSSICGLNKAAFDYDSLTRTIAVKAPSGELRGRVGSSTVLLDGKAQALARPVDLYKGMVVIPEELRGKLEELLCRRLGLEPLRKLRCVVIDPGHGGKDPGAPGTSGRPEKELVLDIAGKLRELLRQEGVKTVMTRSSDVFIPLERRSEIANDSRADLFISIHANSNNVRSLKGFEVYYVSPEVSDAKRAVSSARTGELNLDRSCLLDPGLNLKAILWDLTYAYNRRESIELSRMICRAMKDNERTRVIGVKDANFSVLRGTQMPSVLVEVGFISNPSEESLISHEEYREELARRILEGLGFYCEGVGWKTARDEKIKEGT